MCNKISHRNNVNANNKPTHFTLMLAIKDAAEPTNAIPPTYVAKRYFPTGLILFSRSKNGEGAEAGKADAVTKAPPDSARIFMTSIQGPGLGALIRIGKCPNSKKQKKNTPRISETLLTFLPMVMRTPEIRM